MFVGGEPWTSASNPSETYSSFPIDEAGGKGSAGLGTSGGAYRRLQPDESPGFGTEGIVHVAYRQTDHGSVNTRRHQLKQQQQQHQPAPEEVGWDVSTSSPPVAVRNMNDKRAGPRTHLREDEHFWGEVESVEGRDDRAENQEEQREGDLERRLLVKSEGSRESDVGWGGDGDPFGAVPECPSIPRVLQIGIAMDAGMFKVRPLVASQDDPR